MNDIVALVAVRTGSTRLPAKAFRKIGEQPIIDILIDRLAGAVTFFKKFIVCTTTLPEDDRIEEHCLKRDVLCYRGDRENVLGRFIEASRRYPSQYVARITGDNPFSDFIEMENAVQYALEQGLDYVRPHGVPLGTAIEVIRTESLLELNDRTTSQHLTEYMTWFFELAPFIRSGLYPVQEKVRFENLRLTIDYEEDVQFANRIVAHFGRWPTLQELVQFCRTLSTYPAATWRRDPVLEEKIKSQIVFSR